MIARLKYTLGYLLLALSALGCVAFFHLSWAYLAILTEQSDQFVVFVLFFPILLLHKAGIVLPPIADDLRLLRLNTGVWMAFFCAYCMAWTSLVRSLCELVSQVGERKIR